MADAAWVALSLIRNIGGRTLNALLDTFGTPEAVLAAPLDQLWNVKGVGPATAEAIKDTDLQAVMERLARWRARGVRDIGQNEPAYPDRLHLLEDAPPTLFVKGRWPVTNGGSTTGMTPRAVAVVGTRTPTPAAIDVTQQIAFDLAHAGITIVSGLALGIDTAAHFAALAAPTGVTVGVLGSGVLEIYPRENRALADSIELRGALICEVAPQARVSTTGLVARNRIISGLSQAVVVIQTDSDGGALHAARFAQQQGRRVYFIDDPMGSRDAVRGIALLRDSGAIPLPISVSGVDWLE